MKNVIAPRWILLYNCLPVITLLGIFFTQYKLVESLMTKEDKYYWIGFGAILLVMTVINLLYSRLRREAGKTVGVEFALFNLISHVVFLYLYFYNIDNFIPDDVPRWMLVSDKLYFYAQTFLMPTLAMSLFTIVVKTTPNTSGRASLRSFLLAFIVPVVWYFIFLFISSLEFNGGFSSVAFWHWMTIVFVACTILFFFLLVRAIYALNTQSIKEKFGNSQLFTALIAIVLPLAGLILNTTLVNRNFDFMVDSNTSGVFGHFHYLSVYILTILNGVLLMIPANKSPNARLLLFAARSVTFAFTLYFLIVFLPYLPLSIIAILAIGSGFLMLTPLLLFILHTKIIYTDYQYLKTSFSKGVLNAVFLISMAVIPAVITFNFIQQKKTLTKAINYVYQSDYNETLIGLNSKHLMKTIANVKRHKRGDNILFGNHTPYLSSFYKWLVLDNLTLSNSKIKQLEKIFIGDKDEYQNFKSWDRNPPAAPTNPPVLLTDATVNSTYDAKNQQWTSWIDLELTNTNQKAWPLGEYITYFKLPDGVFISDYYLYVEPDRKEYGILAEEKAATWVYNQIRNENRDPGILTYSQADEIEFKVFPFDSNQVRRTGIQFTHRDPINLSFDGLDLQLGNAQQSGGSFKTQHFAYVSAIEKEGLENVSRTPYLHILVNTGNEQEKNADDHIRRIEKLKAQYPKLAKNAKLTLVNYDIENVPLERDWKNMIRNADYIGGFFLKRALSYVAQQSYEKISNSYPIIVVINDDESLNSFEAGMGKMAEMAFPEMDEFYLANADGELTAVPFGKNENQTNIGEPVIIAKPNLVLKWPLNGAVKAILPDNVSPSMLVLSNPNSNYPIVKKSWKTAANMQAESMWQQLYPSNSTDGWLPLLQKSFESRIMMPSSSYIVVENEAQKNVLARKQRQAMEGNQSLDLANESQGMSEPSFWVLLLLGLFGWLYNNRHQ